MGVSKSTSERKFFYVFGSPTVIVIVAIFVLAFSGGRIARFGRNILGREFPTLTFIFFLCLVLCALVLFVRRNGVPKWKNIVIGLSLLAPFGVVVFLLKAPVDRIHIIEYCTLGWFMSKDLRGKWPALVWAGFIGVLDEGIHWILPWRVWDLRDVLVNVFSSSLGWVVFLLTQNHNDDSNSCGVGPIGIRKSISG